jgi:hypothetical protein
MAGACVMVARAGMPQRAIDHFERTTEHRPVRLRELCARGATWRGCMDLVAEGYAITVPCDRWQPTFARTERVETGTWTARR